MNRSNAQICAFQEAVIWPAVGTNLAFCQLFCSAWRMRFRRKIHAFKMHSPLSSDWQPLPAPHRLTLRPPGPRGSRSRLLRWLLKDTWSNLLFPRRRRHTQDWLAGSFLFCWQSGGAGMYCRGSRGLGPDRAHISLLKLRTFPHTYHSWPKSWGKHIYEAENSTVFQL